MFHDRFARQNRLRTSIRVSPDLILHKHRSPSFGSQDIRYNSNLSPQFMIGRWCPPIKEFPPVLLSLCIRVFNTQILAHILDSLVRVSRRADDYHFVSVLLLQIHTSVVNKQCSSVVSWLVPSKSASCTEKAYHQHKQPTLTIYMMHTHSNEKDKHHTNTLVAVTSLSTISGTF